LLQKSASWSSVKPSMLMTAATESSGSSCTRLTIGLPRESRPPGRDLVHGQLVDLSLAREHEEIGERVRDEDLAHAVLLARLHPLRAEAAAPLLAVLGERRALHVAGDGQRHGLALVGEQVVDRDLARRFGEARAALVAVLLLDRDELAPDERQELLRVARGSLRAPSRARRARVLLLDLLALHAGEALEPQIEDRLRLDLAERERRDETVRASSGVPLARMSAMIASS
jgi:hypothetical protein